MTTRNAAMTTGELAALGSVTAAALSVTAAGLVVWLLLARPFEVVDAVRGHDLGGLAQLVVATLQDLLMRLIELL